MDHAVMLHNLLSLSSLPNNASPHLLWTGKLGNTKMLRVFGCMVQYRPHTSRAGRFSQRAQWGLHLGIEKHYNAWKIFDVHSKETIAARDAIFYERLTLQTYLDNLAANRDLTGGFCGNRAFASAAFEADWDEQNVDGASEEAGPLPYCSVDIPMDDNKPHESSNAETYSSRTASAAHCCATAAPPPTHCPALPPVLLPCLRCCCCLCYFCPACAAGKRTACPAPPASALSALLRCRLLLTSTTRALLLLPLQPLLLPLQPLFLQLQPC
ncbi:unnamed protein product [Closterium sp. NIES-54]